MRWIDIPLPTPGTCQPFDALVREARERADAIASLQQNEGLDGLRILQAMADTGRLLFRAVQAADPYAFRPETAIGGVDVPSVGRIETDRLVGFHLVAPHEHLTVPWTWLHNGLGFVFERHPLSAGPVTARVPEALPPRTWMQRFSAALFDQNHDRERGSRRRRRQPPIAGAAASCTRPEILFVPGHGDEEIRRLIYREADGIRDALREPGLPLAELMVPRTAVTPQQLATLSFGFQAIHYAGPTSQPLSNGGVTDAAWLAELEAAAGADSFASPEELVGLEPDIVGVDPLDALLDTVVERYETSGPPTSSAPSSPGDDRFTGSSETASESTGTGESDAQRGDRRRARRRRRSSAEPSDDSWLLDDGPVKPESLASCGGVPPLVFSNSHCSLPELGQRFLAAGASAFVGPLIALYSRPARRYAALFYSFLSEGRCAGAALHAAALALRDELGPEHPAWLSYGLIGYGAVALQYL